MILRFLPLFAVLFAVCACSSLPFPDSPTESLLIVPAKIEGEIRSGEEEIIMVTLFFLNAADGDTAYTVVLEPEKPMGIQKMIPGEYLLETAEILRRETGLFGKDTADSISINRRIALGGRSVQLFDGTCVLSQGGDNGYSFEIMNAPGEEEQIDLFMELTEDPRWPAWERYELPGFPDDTRETARERAAAEAREAEAAAEATTEE